MYRLILGLLCIGCAAITACATQSVQPISASTATAPPPPPPPPYPAILGPPPGYRHIIASDIRFDFDCTIIPPGSYGTDSLDYLAEAIAYHEDLIVTAEGHTCAAGTAEYNQRLGMWRAEAVRDYLLHRGADPDRVKAVSYGESRPIEFNPEFMVNPIPDSYQRRVTFQFGFRQLPELE